MKKPLTVLMALLLAAMLLLSGCSRQESPEPDRPSETPAPADTIEPEPTAEPEEPTDEPTEPTDEPETDAFEEAEDIPELEVEDEYVVQLEPDQGTTGW